MVYNVWLTLVLFFIEFSCENALICTEYIQIKNVLKVYFKDILNKLETKHRDVRFNVLLPGDDTIPKSLIAQQLNNELSQLIENNGNIIDEENIKDVCYTIINNFSLMFDKYIDATNAIFMVNIRMYS